MASISVVPTMHMRTMQMSTMQMSTMQMSKTQTSPSAAPDGVATLHLCDRLVQRLHGASW
jgi:hypothetical protein